MMSVLLNSRVLLAGFFIVTCAGAALAEGGLQFKAGEITIQELKAQAPVHLLSTTRDATLLKKRYFVLQYHASISASDQAQLENAGVSILRYIPENAYLVFARENQLSTLRGQNSNINDFAYYRADYRVSDELRVRHVFNSANFKAVRLQLFSNVNAAPVAGDLINDGWQVLEVAESVIVVRAQVKDFARLSEIEGVEWMSQVPKMQLRHLILPQAILDDNRNSPRSFRDGDLNELSGYESGTKVMNFDAAWARGYMGQGQTVAVSDTGLDTGDVRTLASDFKNYSQGFVLGYGSTSWADFAGHGTHVTGSVGSVGSLSNGKITGGATQAQLIMQSLWSVTHETLTTPGDLRVIFKQAYAAGARIHTNSWGDPETRGLYNSETSEVDQFVWDNPDMVILFAAGNDGVDANSDGRIDAGSISAPATAKNIISVGASENLVRRGGIQSRLGNVKIEDVKPWPVDPIAGDTLSNNINGVAAFSSRGPTTDGRIKPDVVAPGSNILSDCSHTQGAEELWGRFNADYCFSGGTSMATPLTAAGAAIVRQHLQKAGQQNPSAALIKAVILHTAVDMYPGQFGELGESKGQELLKRGANPDQGYGRVDVSAATAFGYQVVDEKSGVANGQSISVNVVGRRLAKVTLVYTDAPGAPTAQKALVNNLDLEVQVNGRILGRSESRVDNTEQIVFSPPLVTPVTILVKGTGVSLGRNGKQPFSLIYSE